MFVICNEHANRWLAALPRVLLDVSLAKDAKFAILERR